MANINIKEKLSGILEKVFSQKTERIENQQDFDRKYQHLFQKEYDAIILLIMSVRSSSELQVCMNNYLQLYGRYNANKNNIHYYRSDQVFVELILQSVKVTNDKGDLFELWDNFLTGNKISDDYNSFKKRFDELNVTWKSQINAFRKQQRDKNHKDKSILDVLKDEYIKLNGYRIKSNNDLYGFDPYPNSWLFTELDDHLTHIKIPWNIKNQVYDSDKMETLNKTIDKFIDWLKNQADKNIFALFQIIKTLQGSFKIKTEQKIDSKTNQTWTQLITDDLHESFLYRSLYVLSLVQLMKVAQVDKLLTRNRHGFTTEEIDFYLKPIIDSRFEYSSNLERVLKSSFNNIKVLFSEIKCFLDTYIVTLNQLKGADLLNLKETMRIQNLWVEFNDFTESVKYAVLQKDSRRLEILYTDPKNQTILKNSKVLSERFLDLTNSGPDLAKGKFYAGSHVGTNSRYGDITIVYIGEDTNQVYIEYASLKPQIFLVHAGYISDAFYSSKILEIYNSTIGIVYFTQALFMAIGFMPVLIEAGFAGLIYEIVIQYVGDKLEEQVAKINPTLGTIVGLAFQFAAPRPSFKPKINEVGISTERMETTGLSDVLNVPGKDHSFLNRSIDAEHAEFLTGLEKKQVEDLLSKIRVEEETMQMHSGLPLMPKDLAKYAKGVFEPRIPIEWRVALEQSQPLRKLIEKAESVKLVRLTEKKLEAPHFQYQRSSMGSEYELHIIDEGISYELDGIIIDQKGGTFIGESKKTYKGDWEVFEAAGKKNPDSSMHYKKLDESFIPQIKKYSKLAKKYGFQGVSVQTNTEFLWATFEQVTRDMKNVEVILNEFDYRTQKLKPWKPPRKTKDSLFWELTNDDK